MKLVRASLGLIFLLTLGLSLRGAAFAQEQRVLKPRFGPGPGDSGPRTDTVALPFPASERRTLGLSMLSRASGSSGWVVPAGAAVAGGLIGFSIAAPDCLDGSRGCGSKPLVYTAIGVAVGAGAGWILHRLLSSR